MGKSEAVEITLQDVIERCSDDSGLGKDIITKVISEFNKTTIGIMADVVASRESTIIHHPVGMIRCELGEPIQGFDNWQVGVGISVTIMEPVLAAFKLAQAEVSGDKVDTTHDAETTPLTYKEKILAEERQRVSDEDDDWRRRSEAAAGESERVCRRIRDAGEVDSK